MKLRADLLLDVAMPCPMSRSSTSLKAMGLIYNDSRDRFNDGDSVVTSSIVSLSMEDGYVLLETVNTTYRIITEADIQS